MFWYSCWTVSSHIDVFQGEIPERFIVGLVSSKVLSGYYSFNPFNFEHFNCNFAAFYVDGKSVSSAPLEPNFNIGNFVTTFFSMVWGKKIRPGWFYFQLSRNGYLKGYCLYMFDVNPSYEEENTLPLLKKRHSRLQLEFEKALPESVTCICYGKFPAILSIDSSRNVEIKLWIQLIYKQFYKRTRLLLSNWNEFLLQTIRPIRTFEKVSTYWTQKSKGNLGLIGVCVIFDRYFSEFSDSMGQTPEITLQRRTNPINTLISNSRVNNLIFFGDVLYLLLLSAIPCWYFAWHC